MLSENPNAIPMLKKKLDKIDCNLPSDKWYNSWYHYTTINIFG